MKSEQFQQFGTFTLKLSNFGIDKQRTGSQKAQIQTMIAADVFRPWASRLNLLMFSSSIQGSAIVSHITPKLGGLEQSLLPASSFSLPDSAPTVAPFHGFWHLLADLGLAGVKMASPDRLVHVVDNGTFLSMGLSSFKSSLTSFYNIPAVGGGDCSNSGPSACTKSLLPHSIC